jgi:hypothetical protein
MMLEGIALKSVKHRKRYICPQNQQAYQHMWIVRHFLLAKEATEPPCQQWVCTTFASCHQR